MHLVQSDWSIQGLFRGSWDESLLAHVETSMPDLARRIERVAESTRFGSGRPASDLTQAAMLLGGGRVRHIALWHCVLELLDEAGTSEALALAGWGLVEAQDHGFDSFSGLSLGLCARLGPRLLLREHRPPGSVLRLVEASGGGAHLEQCVYGTTADALLCRWIRDLGLSNDLEPLARTQAGTTERAFVEQLLARGEGELEWPIPGVAHELARMLGVRVLPTAAPAGRDPTAVVEAVAEVLAERSQLDQRIEALQADLEAMRAELQGMTGPRAGGLLGPSEILERVHMEVARARRYRRHLSLVAVGIDPSDHAVEPKVVLEHMAARFQAAFRSSDAVGLFDRTRLIVILPETPVSGARLFSERTEYALRKTPLEHEGLVVPLRPQLFGMSLEQQGDHDADGMLFAVLDGVEGMEPGERVKWNTTGQSTWRVNG